MYLINTVTVKMMEHAHEQNQEYQFKLQTSLQHTIIPYINCPAVTVWSEFVLQYQSVT